MKLQHTNETNEDYRKRVVEHFKTTYSRHMFADKIDSLEVGRFYGIPEPVAATIIRESDLYLESVIVRSDHHSYFVRK